MSEIEEGPIAEPNYAATLDNRAKTFRDKFVEEYLVDYDALGAARRIGYTEAYARMYSIRLMQEPYVLQQIRLKETCTDEEDSVEDMRKRVVTGLIREANYRGTGSSQSARVAALDKLAGIYGLHAPTKNKTELTGADGQPLNGGVFVVPGLMTTEQWEIAAAAQQAALTAPDNNQ